MNPSRRKQKLVEELSNLQKEFNVQRIYGYPSQAATQDYLAEIASVLKNLDENDYREIVRLSKTINPTESRKKRKRAALEIDTFLKRKVAEYKRCDFSSLDKEKSEPILKFGEPGKAGQRVGGVSVFIQANNLNISGGGYISADGGNVINSGKIINFGTLNQQVAGTVNDISRLTQLVSESNLDESEKRQLIGDIETIKAQVIKPRPDKGILQKAWGVAEGAATIGGAAQLVKMIGEAISPFLK